MLDVRTCSPATEQTMTDPTDVAAAAAFRESIRRAIAEIKPVAPELAVELRRTFRILSNVAFLQRDALSPEMLTRDAREAHAELRAPETAARMEI